MARKSPIQKFHQTKMLRHVAKLNSWRAFSERDWADYPHVQAYEPLITEDEDGDTYIIDDVHLYVIPKGAGDLEKFNFSLVADLFNPTEEDEDDYGRF